MNKTQPDITRHIDLFGTTLITDQAVPVYPIGRVVGQPGVLAVSTPPKGATMFLCPVHHSLFKPTGHCQKCTETEAPHAA